jgi:hypothetical protein
MTELYKQNRKDENKGLPNLRDFLDARRFRRRPQGNGLLQGMNLEWFKRTNRGPCKLK